MRRVKEVRVRGRKEYGNKEADTPLSLIESTYKKKKKKNHIYKQTKRPLYDTFIVKQRRCVSRTVHHSKTGFQVVEL
jgi:hypothetical protein